MTASPPLPVEFLRQPGQITTAVRTMSREPAIALDTESNSFHHYPEQLCLIQTATRHRVYIIDTISLRDIATLGGILADRSVMKVAHGADYDLRSLDRHWGFHVHRLYDTSIAARFAGATRFGLADLVSDLLGVTIAKSKRLQRADWGRRPLSAEAIDYAAADVRHLLALWETLDQRLNTLGRAGWVAEECARLEAVRYARPDPEIAYLSVKGAGDLDGRGLAVLESLYLFREREALRQHRPPFFVLPDTTLCFLAANPAADLAGAPGLGYAGLRRYGPGIRQALREGQAAPPVRRPPRAKRERPGPDQIQRLARLKAWRAALGASLSLDPSLLWPTTSLEALAIAPHTIESEIASADVREWQRAEFASLLRRQA